MTNKTHKSLIKGKLTIKLHQITLNLTVSYLTDLNLSNSMSNNPTSLGLPIMNHLKKEITNKTCK